MNTLRMVNDAYRSCLRAEEKHHVINHCDKLFSSSDKQQLLFQLELLAECCTHYKLILALVTDVGVPKM